LTSKEGKYDQKGTKRRIIITPKRQGKILLKGMDILIYNTDLLCLAMYYHPVRRRNGTTKKAL